MSEDGAVTTPAPGAPAGEVPYVVSPEEYWRGYKTVPYEPPREAWRRRLTAFVPTVLVLPLFGAPAALLWRALTPRVGIAQTAAGPQPTAGETDQFFAIEGWFVVTTICVGLVLGAVAWRFLRERGPASALGLAVGGLAASAVTAVVGSRLVVDSYMYGFCHQPDVSCTVYDGTLTLRATVRVTRAIDSPAALVAWPIAMLLSFAALTFLRERG